MPHRARSVLVHPYRGCKWDDTTLHPRRWEQGYKTGLLLQRAALGDSGRTDWGNPILWEGSVALGEGNRKEVN